MQQACGISLIQNLIIISESITSKYFFFQFLFPRGWAPIYQTYLYLNNCQLGRNFLPQTCFLSESTIGILLWTVSESVTKWIWHHLSFQEKFKQFLTWEPLWGSDILQTLVLFFYRELYLEINHRILSLWVHSC